MKRTCRVGNLPDVSLVHSLESLTYSLNIEHVQPVGAIVCVDQPVRCSVELAFDNF